MCVNALRILKNYVSNDAILKQNFNPLKSVIQGLKLSRFVNYVEADLQLYDNNAKNVFDFCLWIVEEYGQEYDYSINDVQNDNRFIAHLKKYQ